MRLGVTELVLVLVLVLIFVGPKQIPKLAETIGLSMKSFKRGISDSSAEVSETHEPADQTGDAVK